MLLQTRNRFNQLFWTEKDRISECRNSGIWRGGNVKLRKATEKTKKETTIWERRPEEVIEAIEKAKRHAEEQRVPLTVERLASELKIPLEEFRHCLRGGGERGRRKTLLHILRQAAEEANASVLESALSRGSSVNMHLQYLRQYAGYGDQKEEQAPTIVFRGEEDL